VTIGAGAALPILALALALPGCVLPAPASAPQPISDAAIAVYTAKPYDKRQMMGRHEVLGTRDDVRVMADYPCSDLCPQYTTRIVHYDLEPGPGCDRVRGVAQNLLVPMGIAVLRKAFCVPAVLAGKQQ
jgi:hypothetical protein